MNGIGKKLSSRSGNPTENFELLIILKLLFRQMLSIESQMCKYVFFRGVSVNITTIHIIAYYERILNYVL